jgi:hypothetical protein
LLRRIPPLLSVLAALACAGGPPAPGPSPSGSAAGSPSPAADSAAPLPSPLPDILARVNGQPILARQVVPYAKRLFDRLERPKDERERDKPRILRQALREYIDRELLLQEAVARGLHADDRAVQYAYDRARVDHPDDKDWAGFLASIGSEPQAYKAEIRTQATIHLLLEDAGEGLKVMDAEARQRYDAAPEEFPPPEGQPAGFALVKEQVKARLREEARSGILGRLLTDLRARARIETYI